MSKARTGSGFYQCESICFSGSVVVNTGVSHDENNRYGAAEVRSMQKEMPSGWAKMAEEWSQYSQYTAGMSQ